MTRKQSRENTDRKPTDARDKIDIVRWESPVPLRGIMNQTATYTRDEVFIALEWAESEGIVSSREGDLEQDGTTERLWVWEGENDDD